MGVKNYSELSRSPGVLPQCARPRSGCTGAESGLPGNPGLFCATAVVISVVDLTSKAVAQSLLHGTMVHTNPALSLGHAPLAPEVHMPAAGMGIVVYCILACWCIATLGLPFWPPAALLGGALGNFIDHLQGGGIVDFIRVGTLIFNLADVAVLVGLGGVCALGMIRLFREDRLAAV